MEKVLKKLKQEYYEISTRCDKLDLFLIEKGKNIDIHKEYINLMKEQLEIMYEYRECLYQRIKYIVNILEK